MKELRDICKSYAETVENAYNDGELYDYLSDHVLNVELRITPDKQLRSVEYMLAYGGPTVYLDTKERAILGYWGSDSARWGISSDLCDTIEDDAAQIYNLDY